MRPFGGDEEDRTPDPLLAKQVLSQLSYTPMFGFPSVFQASFCRHSFSLSILKIEQCFLSTCSPLLTEAFELSFVLLRKEVIQPHLPIRLPCYDFTPVINPTLDGVLPKVRRPALGVTDSHGVTGGVYKARERIHRSMLICDYEQFRLHAGEVQPAICTGTIFGDLLHIAVLLPSVILPL